jgi:ABC-type Fe3+ transport system substrate-binding protein
VSGPWMPWSRVVCLIVAAAALGSCAPATPSAPGAAPASVSTTSVGGTPALPVAGSAAEWEIILQAARREGVVECACPPRPDYARLIKEGFENAVPGIRLETAQATLPEFWSRIEKEQQAGQYLWDVYLFGATAEMFALKNKGAFETFRDYMVGPDIGDNSKWEGGIDRAFLDAEKRYIFSLWLNTITTITVNRDALPTAQIRIFDDLLRPEYRDKIVIQDPRGGGAGISFMAGAFHFKGRDGLRQLLVEQQPLIVRTSADQADQVVRGGKPIAVPALVADTLEQFLQAGIRLNLEDIRLTDIPSVSPGGTTPAVLKNPPHPNATKVFINWLLSAPAQELMTTALHANSLRTDVPPYDPSDRIPAGATYLHTRTEDSMTGVVVDAQRAARELVP